MVFRRDSSPQTRAVLECLQASPQEWRHGYEIARRTALASGTLYPILGRLSDRGLLETRWEDDPPEGRPRRHLYRLTAEGAVLAATLASAPAPAPAASAPAAGQVGLRPKVRARAAGRGPVRATGAGAVGVAGWRHVVRDEGGNGVPVRLLARAMRRGRVGDGP